MNNQVSARVWGWHLLALSCCFASGWYLLIAETDQREEFDISEPLSANDLHVMSQRVAHYSSLGLSHEFSKTDEQAWHLFVSAVYKFDQTLKYLLSSQGQEGLENGSYHRQLRAVSEQWQSIHVLTKNLGDQWELFMLQQAKGAALEQSLHTMINQQALLLAQVESLGLSQSLEMAVRKNFHTAAGILRSKQTYSYYSAELADEFLRVGIALENIYFDRLYEIDDQQALLTLFQLQLSIGENLQQYIRLEKELHGARLILLNLQNALPGLVGNTNNLMVMARVKKA